MARPGSNPGTGRHCKPMLAFGASSRLSEHVGISATVPNGAQEPGIVLAVTRNVDEALDRFVQALIKHRHFERETHPPRV